MNWWRLIAVLLWVTMSTLSISSYFEAIASVEERWKKGIAFLVFAVGGPVFAIYDFLYMILDLILPAGWDDDDDNDDPTGHP